MTVEIKDGDKVVGMFLVGEEKLSTSGKPNRYAGGKLQIGDKVYQVGCNITQIIKK